ncbi:helix-turn-helix transcriptional regulator [Tautonia marina]|uniref:helix-turn-helix transcriptional regulator n=1 Tax=Tautonia marina TaxID=2653855 RepID=UPI001375B38E|nr:helix-turn-helix transcriptional regulator [Tautonia marina]
MDQDGPYHSGRSRLASRWRSNPIEEIRLTPAQRIRSLLALKGLNVVDLAKAAGLDRQAVWKIVRGETANPGLVTIERIVEAAGSTMLEFYALKEPSAMTPLQQEVLQVVQDAVDTNGSHAWLTAHQILNRLPAATRDPLIKKRGGVGLGSGASFSPTRDVGIAIEGLGDVIERTVLDARGATFEVAGQSVPAGFPFIALYRMNKDRHGTQGGESR